MTNKTRLVQSTLSVTKPHKKRGSHVAAHAHAHAHSHTHTHDGPRTKLNKQALSESTHTVLIVDHLKKHCVFAQLAGRLLFCSQQGGHRHGTCPIITFNSPQRPPSPGWVGRYQCFIFSGEKASSSPQWRVEHKVNLKPTPIVTITRGRVHPEG